MKTKEKIMSKLPKGMQRVGLVAEECVYHLMKQGKSQKKAEDIVIEILKESKPYLEMKMYDSVIASLKMIFMDAPVSVAAKEMLNN